MIIHQGFDHLPPISNAVVSIGSFDGVHLGHRHIIDKMQHTAKQLQGETVIISFDPHPRHVLPQKDGASPPMLLNSMQEKASLLEDLGIHHLIILAFTKPFANTSHQDFVQQYLVNKLHAKAVIVGDNHRFGKDRAGNSTEVYAQHGIAHHSKIQLISAQHHTHISSTIIRQQIALGQLDTANRLLGAPYAIQGKVIRKTAWNMMIAPTEQHKLLLPNGTYQMVIHMKHQRIEDTIDLEIMKKKKTYINLYFRHEAYMHKGQPLANIVCLRQIHEK